MIAETPTASNSSIRFVNGRHQNYFLPVREQTFLIFIRRYPTNEMEGKSLSIERITN